VGFARGFSQAAAGLLTPGNEELESCSGHQSITAPFIDLGKPTVQVTQMRQFAFILTFVLLLTAPCSAGKTVKNSTLGFEIELPDEWTELGSKEFYDNLNKLELDNPKFQDLLTKNASIPVVIATKYPEPYDDVNPSLKINARPYGAIPTRDAVEIAGLLLAGIKQLYPDLEVVSPPSPKNVDARKGAHVQVRYSLKTSVGTFPIESELWVIPTENFFYMIGIGYRPDGKTGSRDDAASSIEKMKILTP
jgi:hypothetical protein